MKSSKNQVRQFVLMVIITLTPLMIFAQEDQGMQKEKMHSESMGQMEDRIPNLTADQKAQIKEIGMKSRKSMMARKNEMDVLEAQLKQMKAAEAPDQTAINAKIDAITNLKNAQAKEKVAREMEIKALLNDEQKVAFDELKSERGGKQHKRHH